MTTYSTKGGKATITALNAALAASVAGHPTFADIFDETQLDAARRRSSYHFDPSERADSMRAQAWHDALVEAGLDEMARQLDPWLPLDPKVTTIASRAAIHPSTITDVIG